MPLYMDFHIIPDVTIEDVKMAHIADKAVQDRFGVKYHQFWVNEDAGTVFCLMEGPNKEACAATHREAHGNIACKIEEVAVGFYQSFMEHNSKLDGGVVLNKDGTADRGYRLVLGINIYGNTKITSNRDYKKLRHPDKPKKFVAEIITKYQGKQIRPFVDDSIMAAFKSPENVLNCAHQIHRELSKRRHEHENSEWNITYKMGIGCSQPLNENQGFFEQAIKLAERLSLIAGKQEILVSNTVKRLCNNNILNNCPVFLRILEASEEKFLNNLFNAAEEKLSNDCFSISSLGRDIGISRPQLYRKVQSIIKDTPNGFIRNLKMHKALLLLKEQELNISQIALEVGYNNPSYFAKCFKETYGVSPSQVLN
ncbi:MULTISPECIES: nickel-binding protein [Galbibacter]|uniref:DUF4242 domain-containing protein n=1 Tax=Galbibacter pacificus TaxID=2996052 RepID=A0ABT6FVT8_9FLAO|nr:nickel-binding protein [Galbibacter pacificus]MDG3583886.1 DUF4242 domain-containing protein [Galbibacter pacificus]MDG3587196.1 DUF4242 domain-containing protein [Galbibacter pacificus]